VPLQANGAVTELFPGTIANIPSVTDPKEIKNNEEIAMMKEAKS